MKMNKIFLASLIIFLASIALSAQSIDRILLEEDFSKIKSGPLSNNVGAHTEYHYLPEAAPRCNWIVSNDRGWWSIRKTERGSYLYQSEYDKELYAHPTIITGDEFWRDYKITAKFQPESDEHQCGIIFRYQNDLCYYFFGLDKNKFVLKLVNYQKGFHIPNEKILAGKDFVRDKSNAITVSISVTEDKIKAELENGISFTVIDSTFTKGKIGMVANVPAKLLNVKVAMTNEAFEKYQDEKTSFNEVEKKLQNENPKPVLWKKISTEGFGVGRNLRFGDLDNDGKVDVLIGQVVHHGPKDRNSELSCLTAMTFEGKMLWQIGKPDAWKDNLTNDVAFQIYDIDRDGKNEVIYCKDFELIVADGATGKTKYKTATPKTPGGKPTPTGNNIFDRILGDCIYICDLSGKGYPADIILKDRYTHLWAYDNKLELLWEGESRTGHYPYAYDIDKDGKDELLIGYTMFDDNGKKLWTLDDKIQDHADGVAVIRFKENDEPKILCAASDEGIFFADPKGNIIKHHYVGHVQNPATANFRDDLPGLETVSINFWSNQGIIHFYDSDGNIFHSFEPNQYGSMCLPVNWTGKSEEFFILNPNVDEGGMYDGWGRKVVQFPDDGHPDMCYAVLDITGDCRDEIVVWDPHEIWVYTQDDNPKKGNLYKPKRNPLYNYSNYQATVSIP